MLVRCFFLYLLLDNSKLRSVRKDVQFDETYGGESLCTTEEDLWGNNCGRDCDESVFDLRYTSQSLATCRPHLGAAISK